MSSPANQSKACIKLAHTRLKEGNFREAIMYAYANLVIALPQTDQTVLIRAAQVIKTIANGIHKKGGLADDTTAKYILQGLSEAAARQKPGDATDQALTDSWTVCTKELCAQGKAKIVSDIIEDGVHVNPGSRFTEFLVRQKLLLGPTSGVG